MFLAGLFLSPFYLDDSLKEVEFILKLTIMPRKIFQRINQTQGDRGLFITSKKSGIFNLLEIKRNVSVPLCNCYCTNFISKFCRYPRESGNATFSCIWRKKKEICLSNIIITSIASWLLMYPLFKIVPWKS